MSNNFSYRGEIKNPENPKTEINDSLLIALNEKSKNMGIMSISYSKLAEDIFNNDNKLEYSNAIVLTIPIDITVDDGVYSKGAQELYDEYISFGDITYELSDLLRKEGFATQVLHPAEDMINLSKLGQEAGLGYIGKNGLLITPELGPRLKIAGILTTIENFPFCEINLHEWIEDYCKTCDECIEGCPENALIEQEDKLAKAKFIEEKCIIGCNKGCVCCIKVCPFFEKGYNWVKENKQLTK